MICVLNRIVKCSAPLPAINGTCAVPPTSACLINGLNVEIDVDKMDRSQSIPHSTFSGCRELLTDTLLIHNIFLVEPTWVFWRVN